MNVLSQYHSSSKITKEDIIFLAIYLIYGSPDIQQIKIHIPIYGEIKNNRQCENRLLFIEFIMHFMYNYIQNNYIENEYEISITPNNKVSFICSARLSKGIASHFNLSKTNANAWLLNLPRGNKQVFIKYLFVFMHFSESRNVFYSTRDDKLTVSIIYKLVFEYYDLLRCLGDLTDPINIGADKYGFKVDIYKVITNNLIINQLKLINIFQHSYSSHTIPYPDHLEYATTYIKITYAHYQQSILDNPNYEPEPDVFI